MSAETESENKSKTEQETSADLLQCIELDVGDLEPPQPLLTIFSALSQLPPDHRLDVYHRRQPFPLYGMLDQAGYRYQCLPHHQQFLIRIWPGEQANPKKLSQLVAQAPDCRCPE